MLLAAVQAVCLVRSIIELRLTKLKFTCILGGTATMFIGCSLGLKATLGTLHNHWFPYKASLTKGNQRSVPGPRKGGAFEEGCDIDMVEAEQQPHKTVRGENGNCICAVEATDLQIINIKGLKGTVGN